MCETILQARKIVRFGGFSGWLGISINPKKTEKDEQQAPSTP